MHSSLTAQTTIPVAPTSKLAGHLKEYVGHPLDFLEKQWKEHGDIFRFRLAHRSLIVVHHPDYIEHILQKNHTNYRKSLAYRKLKLLLGNGLFTSEGDYWLRQRRLAQPAFNRERIGSYFQTIQAFARELTGKWEASVASGKLVSVHREMTDVTLRVIAKTLLAIDLEKEGRVVEENLPFALNFMIKRVTSTVNWPMAFPLERHLRFKQSVRNLYQLMDQLLQERRKTTSSSNDLLTRLMDSVDSETGQGMDDRQLKDEILTFFLAGHETSAVALSWALYLLAQHPSEMAKVQLEIDAVVGQNELQLEHLRGLPYTLQVIKETMRLCSPVWVMGREALDDDCLGAYKVNKGESIIFSPLLVHRHPDFWPDPEAFQPDRFSPEKEKERHKFAYFPFGGGPRLCIGSNFALLEMQVILVTLLRKFHFSLAETDHPGYHFSLTLRPASEINMRLSLRK